MLSSVPALAAAIDRREVGQRRVRYSLADILALIPKTKRSQIELLVRTGRITPAWPSTGTGYDRAFDARNLFEIAIAAELIALGFDGGKLTKFFRTIMRVILDPQNAVDAEYLVLLPNEAGPVPLFSLVSATDLNPKIALWNTVLLVNVRNVLSGLRVAVEQFHQASERQVSRDQHH